MKFKLNQTALSLGKNVRLSGYWIRVRAKKYGPDILVAAGIAGGAGTVALAIHATKKTIRMNDEVGIPENKKLQKVKVYAKIWAPTVLTGLAATGCVLGAHGMLKKSNAVLMASLTATMADFADYRQRVKDTFGEEAEARLMNTKTVENPSTGDAETAIDPASHYVIHFNGDTSTEYNKVNPDANGYFLKCLQDRCEFLMGQKSHKSKNGVYHLFLNEMFLLAGMPHTQEGALVGWVCGEDEKDGHIDLRIQQVGPNDFIIDPNVDGVIIDKI